MEIKIMKQKYSKQWFVQYRFSPESINGQRFVMQD